MLLRPSPCLRDRASPPARRRCRRARSSRRRPPSRRPASSSRWRARSRASPTRTTRPSFRVIRVQRRRTRRAGAVGRRVPAPRRRARACAPPGATSVDTKHGQQLKVETLLAIAPGDDSRALEKLPRIGGGAGHRARVREAHRRDLRRRRRWTVLDQEPERLHDGARASARKRAEAVAKAWAAQRAVGRDHDLPADPRRLARARRRASTSASAPRAIDNVSRDPYRLALDVWGVGFKTADKHRAIDRRRRGRAGARTGRRAPDAARRLRGEATYSRTRADLVRDGGAHARAATSRAIERGDRRARRRRAHVQVEDADDDVARVPEGAVSRPRRASRGACALLAAAAQSADDRRAGEAVRAPRRRDRAGDRGASRSGASVDAGPGAAPTRWRRRRATRCWSITGGPARRQDDDRAGHPRPSWIARGSTSRARRADGPRRQAHERGDAAREATTLHRLLEFDPEAARVLAQARSRPIEADALIVDEASMIDVELARRAPARRSPDAARLVLVGDVDQLPSVGPGAVLRDVIDIERRAHGAAHRRSSARPRAASSSQNAHRIQRRPVARERRPAPDGEFYVIARKRGRGRGRDDPRERRDRRIPERFGLDPLAATCRCSRPCTGARPAPPRSTSACRPRSTRAALRRPARPHPARRRQGDAAQERLRPRGLQRRRRLRRVASTTRSALITVRFDERDVDVRRRRSRRADARRTRPASTRARAASIPAVVIRSSPSTS